MVIRVSEWGGRFVFLGGWPVQMYAMFGAVIVSPTNKYGFLPSNMKHSMPGLSSRESLLQVILGPLHCFGFSQTSRGDWSTCQCITYISPLFHGIPYYYFSLLAIMLTWVINNHFIIIAAIS